jgi:hypothetical protein
MTEVTDAPMIGGKRRIDRVLAPEFLEGVDALDMEELRRRRDLCRAEREYLSLVRRLLQGRRDILQAELERRRTGDRSGTIVDQLAATLADAPLGPSRGEAPVVTLPEEELMLARRRVERLLSDARLSDLESMSDEELEDSVTRIEDDERAVSDARTKVFAVHDALQDELKGRWRERVRRMES